MKFTMEWIKAAMIRAIRTAAQVALGMFTVGMAVHEVDWLNILSVTAVAAVYSLITSVATGLPELKDPVLTPEGDIIIDDSNPDVYGLAVNFGGTTVDELAKKTMVTLSVKSGVIKDEATDGE